MALQEQGEIVTLDPKPGFVIKTKVLESLDVTKRPHFTKVFFNVCHDPQVPKPAQDFEPAVVFPMIINNSWEIPIITSQEKLATDKKGNASLVYDCCVNSQCFQWCQVNADLRSILIEWCLEAVETLYEVVLEREYTHPKMLSKGELSRTEIRKKELEGTLEEHMQELSNERRTIIQELGDDEDVDMDVLPDIMNILGKRKVLVEEVEPAKTKNTKKQPAAEMQVGHQVEKQEEKQVAVLEGSNDSNIGLKIVQTRQIQEPVMQKLEYEIVLTSEGQCVKIAVESMKGVEVVYRGQKLMVSREGRLAVVDIGEIDSYRAFWQESDKTLYVFIKG